MYFASLQPCTLQDYPGHVAAMVYTMGCNFRCGYCHNPELVVPHGAVTKEEMLSQEVLLGFLAARRGLLDGVVICGGEPTIHRQLPEFIKKVKNMGFLVKLDTNGSNPDMLHELLTKQVLDYVAMDIKAPLDAYDFCTPQYMESRLRRSIALLKTSGISYEFRSTVLPKIHTAESIKRMGEAIAGAEIWYLQRFSPTHTLDSALSNEVSFSAMEMQQLADSVQGYVQNVQLRL